MTAEALGDACERSLHAFYDILEQDLAKATRVYCQHKIQECDANIQEYTNLLNDVSKQIEGQVEKESKTAHSVAKGEGKNADKLEKIEKRLAMDSITPEEREKLERERERILRVSQNRQKKLAERTAMVDDSQRRQADYANNLAGYEAEKKWAEEREAHPEGMMRDVERKVLLQAVDHNWIEQLDALDDLRQGIRFQSYGNNNPLDVYKQEALQMYNDMMSAIQDDTARSFFETEAFCMYQLLRGLPLTAVDRKSLRSRAWVSGDEPAAKSRESKEGKSARPAGGKSRQKRGRKR